MLIWSDAVFVPGQVLRTCPVCKGACYTDTATCRRCGGEGVLIEPGDWDGPFAEETAWVGKTPEQRQREKERRG